MSTIVVTVLHNVTLLDSVLSFMYEGLINLQWQNILCL